MNSKILVANDCTSLLLLTHAVAQVSYSTMGELKQDFESCWKTDTVKHNLSLTVFLFYFCFYSKEETITETPTLYAACLQAPVHDDNVLGPRCTAVAAQGLLCHSVQHGTPLNAGHTPGTPLGCHESQDATAIAQHQHMTA